MRVGPPGSSARSSQAHRSLITDIPQARPHVLLQAAREQSSQTRGRLRRQRGPVRLLADHGDDRVGDVLAGEGTMPREHLVEDRAERPHVGTLVYLATFGLLRA